MYGLSLACLVDFAQVALALAEGCDGVVSIGGGSVIDSGKAISAIVTNGGRPIDYMEVIGAGKSMTVPALPYIAIPTTSGTLSATRHPHFLQVN